MEEIALPHRSSTLPPPPLANGVSATRALQRFDLGRLRAMDRLAPVMPPAPHEPHEPVVRTTRMPVPARIRLLAPLAHVHVEAPAVAAVAAGVAVIDAKRVAHPVAPVAAAGWALAASASLVGAGSLVTVLVYALLFP